MTKVFTSDHPFVVFALRPNQSIPGRTFWARKICEGLRKGVAAALSLVHLLLQLLLLRLALFAYSVLLYGTECTCLLSHDTDSIYGSLLCKVCCKTEVDWRMIHYRFVTHTALSPFLWKVKSSVFFGHNFSTIRTWHESFVTILRPPADHFDYTVARSSICGNPSACGC